MSARIERRVQSRKRPVNLVYVELPPSNGGMMRDLTEHGFALRAMMPLRQSEKLPFSFILDSSARIDGDAIVVRVEEDGHVAALEFAGLSAHSRDQIRRWLEKFDEPLPKQSSPAQTPVSANSTLEELRTEIRTTEARPKTPSVRLPVSKPVDSPPPSQPREPLQPEPPPLLRLSSVRPESVKQVSASPILTAAKEKSVESPASSITLQDSDLPSPVSIAEPIPSPGPLPVAERVPNFPPALEPLSAFEGETDAATPGWMDHFTLGRAIGIMLLLTLIAGSSVYHRELGHALVWLGLKIAGEESSESLRPQSSPVPAVSVPVRESTEASPVPNAANLPNIPASPAPSAAESTPTKSTEIPSASQTTVAPQLKDSTTPSLVPLTQVTRSPAAAAPTEAPNDAGQQDYQKALAILRTPNREAELPEAVRLLWSSVEKGNVGAEIALAGLYRTGRGVSRNCAQAKILLATAARKGSADAQKRLEDLQHEGCEE